MSKRYGCLIDEIIAHENMEAAFSEVVDKLPAYTVKIYGRVTKKDRRIRYYKHREAILESLTADIKAGTFKIIRFKDIEVHESGKVRKVQSPPVTKRIGVNAIMRVVEKYLYPTVVKTSAAAIKGRGMHHLYTKMRTDIRHDREGTRYFYKCDVRKFYESIDQCNMKMCIRHYIKDPLLLQMLDGFIELLDHGISIGLRSSQCFGNIELSRLDHRMKEDEHARYYYRYCDDIVVLCHDKAECWHYRDIIHEEVEKLGLRLKPNECVRPISEGIDFLGYVDYGDHGRLRKRIKVNAAVKLARIKSRRRRREIIGSFKGMAKWCDSRNLYRKLTGKRMEFKDWGERYVADDGKKRFNGKPVSLRTLINVHISIVDFETDVPTKNGNRTLVSFFYDNGTQGKYFTDDKQQLFYLQKAREQNLLPMGTVISTEVFGDNKVRYIFT